MLGTHPASTRLTKHYKVQLGLPQPERCGIPILPLRVSSSHLAWGIIDKEVWKANWESVTAIEDIALLDATNDHLVVQDFSGHDLQVSTPVGFVLHFRIMLKHFKRCTSQSLTRGGEEDGPCLFGSGQGGHHC